MRVLAVVRWCVHGSLGGNGIGPEGSAAIVGALRHVPSLTQLQYVVGEGASHEAAGCVRRGYDGGRAGPQVFLLCGCGVAASVW
jgi:hypothetical protein